MSGQLHSAEPDQTPLQSAVSQVGGNTSQIYYPLSLGKYCSSVILTSLNVKSSISTTLRSNFLSVSQDSVPVFPLKISSVALLHASLARGTDGGDSLPRYYF